jgi:hypothetical protein
MVMTPTLWIGFGFLAALVVFLIISFFIKDTSSPTQYNTLHFLTALCAGFAGGFLTGDALFKLDGTMANGIKVGLTGTAGFAAFFLIWLTYPKRTLPVPKNAFNVTIPNGWTFEAAVDRIVKAAQGVHEFKGFSKEQLAYTLEGREIKTPSAVEAIKRLRYLCKQLPEYDVVYSDDIFKIETI